MNPFRRERAMNDAPQLVVVRWVQVEKIAWAERIILGVGVHSATAYEPRPIPSSRSNVVVPRENPYIAGLVSIHRRYIAEISVDRVRIVVEFQRVVDERVI